MPEAILWRVLTSNGRVIVEAVTLSFEPPPADLVRLTRDRVSEEGVPLRIEVVPLYPKGGETR